MTCNNDSSIQSKINVIGSISGAQLTFEFTQAAHGFEVGDVIRYDDAYAGFTLAKADSAEHSEVTGVVREIAGDHVYLVTQGVIPIDGFTFARSADRSTSVSGYTASAYFLSGQTAGLLDTAPPTQGGYVVKPTVVNMGEIGGRRYGMIKNYVGNSIGGNASASVHGISPVGSMIPYIGYESRVPSGFTSAGGQFISPSRYTAFNHHIGGKFGYKISIGITGDTPYKRWEFMNDLLSVVGTTSGTSETGRPRFRQEFPGVRQGNGVTSGNPDTGNDVFVIQGDIAEISPLGDQPAENATTGGGPYYINVEITQDNQVDLPRILWAEKWGNEHYATEDDSRYGRHALGSSEVLDYKIRSSFMANYNMEEAVDVFDGTDGLGLGARSRTKIFRQDNTGSHGLDQAGGLDYDLSLYNSYTQESPGHESAYKRIHGNGLETPSPRNVNTSNEFLVEGAYKHPYYQDDDQNGTPLGGQLGALPPNDKAGGRLYSAVNYDGHAPANEREIVSYISATIGAPRPYFTDNPSEDYSNNVRTYIITEDVSYDDLNKRVGGVNINTDSNRKEYEGYFRIAATNENNRYWVPSTMGPGEPGTPQYKHGNGSPNAFLLNTTNAGGADSSGTGNKIDYISITGIRVPDLRDRYLKGKAEPADFIGTAQPPGDSIDQDSLDKPAYQVMNEYDGGVGLRGGTNRTHSQKLLGVSHVSSPATHTLDRHLLQLHRHGLDNCNLAYNEMNPGDDTGRGKWYEVGMWGGPEGGRPARDIASGWRADGTSTNSPAGDVTQNPVPPFPNAPPEWPQPFGGGWGYGFDPNATYPDVPWEDSSAQWHGGVMVHPNGLPLADNYGKSPFFHWNEWWSWNDRWQVPSTKNPAWRPAEGTGVLRHAQGQAVRDKNVGYGRIFGDDGLWNLSGWFKTFCAAEDPQWNGAPGTGYGEADCDNHVIGFNRDRYHRVDTPGIVTDAVATPHVHRDEYGIPHMGGSGLRLKDDHKNHMDYQIIDRDGNIQYGSDQGQAFQAYNPVMHIDPAFIQQFRNSSWSFDYIDGDPFDDGQNTLFGQDYETFAYITNEPKYMTVNWLVRIEDDTAVSLVDDTTFRKLNVDGINDDGTYVTSSDLSPLSLTNLPIEGTTPGAPGDLPAGSVYIASDGSTLKIKT